MEKYKYKKLSKNRGKYKMVKFQEKDHIYTDLNDGSKWISVTTFLHLFEPQKDWDLIAKRYAKKNGLSVEEVKEKWRVENERAINRGTKFHKIREDELLGCNSINNLNVVRPHIENGEKIAQSQKIEPGIYPEKIVCLKSAKICGQIDYPEVTKDYVLNIDDYKTNKEIKMNGFTNWEGVEETLTGPLSHIPNCNYWLYALQLNMYAYIIRKNNPNIKLGRLRILHIIFDENEEVKEIVHYVVPDLQKDIRKAIDFYLKCKK